MKWKEFREIEKFHGMNGNFIKTEYMEMKNLLSSWQEVFVCQTQMRRNNSVRIRMSKQKWQNGKLLGTLSPAAVKGNYLTGQIVR